jgi:hypothetical protein
MSAISLKLEGLEDLKLSLSQDKLDKQLVAGIGVIALQLHNVLNNQIKSYYATNRSLTSVLISKTQSDIKRGTGFIENGLNYRFEAIPLSSYPQYSHFMGNINPEATKQGLVQQVTIVRKRPYRIIKGKLGYGGFVPSNKKGIRVGRWMLERQQKATWLAPGIRAPVKPLFGLSLSQMAAIQFELDKGDVARFKTRIPDLLVKYVNFN